MTKTAEVDFLWHVSELGYQVMDVEGDWIPAPTQRPGGRMLVDLSPHEVAGRGARSYFPLEAANGALFRTFADTAVTEQAILDFANEYGLLGGLGQVAVLLPSSAMLEAGSRGPAAPGPTAGVGVAEPITYWESEILEMRYTVRMWDMAQRASVNELSQYIRWEQSGITIFPASPLSARDSNVQPFVIPPELSRHYFQPRDLVKPALYYVGNTVSRRLSYGLRPQVWLQWDRDWTHLGLQVVPDSLIGALWLQFAAAVDGNQEYRRCLQCRQWVAVDPTRTRADRRFCSDACRSKAYRVRIDEARRMREAGTPLEEIAERLESDPKTVEGWVERPQGRGKRKVQA